MSQLVGIRFLPAGGTAGQYVKVDSTGKPIWMAETPGGVVDEAGAAVANDIGDQTGATTKIKLQQQLDLTQYGGTLVTDLDAITISGPYTCYGTATGVPSADYSWFVQHTNSNVGTNYAYQKAIAYTTDGIVAYERRKISGTWDVSWTACPVFSEAGRALVEAADAAAQRTALELGDSATRSVGTGSGDVAAGNAPAAAVSSHESSYAHNNIPSASEKTALTAGYSALAAGYTQLQALADAEAASALGEFNTAWQLAKQGRGQKLLLMMIQESSQDKATVLFDDLGFPSMMYKLKGPMLTGHIHSDMGSTTALKTVAVTAAGAGYAVNDILTIVGGTGGTVRVLAVDGSGAITSIKIVNPGSGYSAAAGAATTGGAGAGCTITTTIGPVHPAFRVNGVEKTLIHWGMYKGTSFNGTAFHGSGAGWRSICWPGLYPTGSLDLDASRLLHTSKGAGWHLASMYEQGFVSWMSMKMNAEPRGNTYYGRSHESGWEWEYATRFDGLNPGNQSGTAKHKNGSGYDSWAHNGKHWGIHDLVGSMWEWRDGMKEVDGLIYMPEDNYFGLAEASWPSTGAYFDNTVATSGGAPRLSNARDNPLVDPNSTMVMHNAMTLTAGYDTLDLAVRQRMLASMLSTKISSAGTNPWSPKGTLYNRNYGERLPFVGGSWGTESGAGLAALLLNDPRSSAYDDIGFRPAFISP